MTKTALLRSPRFEGHDTGNHPEHPGRIRAIEAELARSGLLRDRPDLTFGPSGYEAVLRVHDLGYLDDLEALWMAGGGPLDGDTIMTPDGWETALFAAGAATRGVDAVIDGEAPSAFALVRPPGHHATPTKAMGFCLLNNAAIAAAHARHRGAERVAVVDIDVHHGNGTQEAFWERDGIFFASLHESPWYPGTGLREERGAGKGEGFTLNVPLPAGTDDRAYLAAFDGEVVPALRAYAPEFIVVSAGFDGHARDPLGNFVLSEQGFADIAHRIVQIADECATGKVVMVLEGGYDVRALARSVAAVVRVLDGTAPDRAVDEEAP